MADPGPGVQLLSSTIGGLVGGGFALMGAWLTSHRSARNDRQSVEREDLIGLASEMIRLSDSMWVADVDHIRANETMQNARDSPQWDQTMFETMREQIVGARKAYTNANDELRSRVAEMRLRQPSIATTAEALWKASMVAVRSGPAMWNPPDDSRRQAEATFIAAVRARLDELA